MRPSIVAQTTDAIPNFGFENWSTVNGTEIPDNWYVRQSYNPEDQLFYGLEKTSVDKYAGSYALKLFNSLTGIGEEDIIYGMIHTLPPNHQEQIQPAFPVSSRHTILTGYYKYAPENEDSCQFLVWMYKNGYVNALTQNVLGGGFATKGASSVFAPFSMDILYYDGVNTIPDSACISLSAFRMYDFVTMQQINPKGNSVLYIDNLSFGGFASEINTIGNSVEGVTIFPNPASSVFTIEMLLKEADYHINLYDSKGSLVKNIASKKLSGPQKIDVNIDNIPSGNYLLIISANEGYISKKLIIQ